MKLRLGRAAGMPRLLIATLVAALVLTVTFGSAAPAGVVAQQPPTPATPGPFVSTPSAAARTVNTLAQIAAANPAPTAGATRPEVPEGLGRGTASGSDGAGGATDGSPQGPGLDAPELGGPIQSFAGQTSPFSPTDSVGDVGPTQYVQMINAAIAVYSKVGAVLAASTNINNLWINGTTAGTGFDQCRTQNVGDPIVLYDQQADRWMVSQFTNPNVATGPGGTFPMCIAYSQTGDATGNWFLYQMDLPASHDYMKYGIWPDALYMSTYEGGNLGAYAFDRAQMLSGSPATFQYFQIGAGNGVDGRENRMLPADWDGTIAPPAGAPNPFLMALDGAFDAPNDRIEIREFHVDWTVPANSTFTLVTTLIPVAFDTDLSCGPVSFRDCIPQPGTAQELDALSNRILHRLQYRNFGTHESMVVNQTVDADGANRAGVRWYEFRKVVGPWTIRQQGTYAPMDGVHRWMGSAAMDASGNVAIGYSASAAATVFPSLRYTGRLANDVLNSLPQGEQTLVAGTTAQTFGNRWGDYSALTVDPVDDCTFWYTGQYNGGSNTWIGSFRFPSCSNLVPPGLIAEHQMSATARNGADVLLAGRNPSDELWYKETTGGVFGAWINIPLSSPILSRPEAIRANSGDIYIFYRGTANDLRYVYRPAASAVFGIDMSLGGVIGGDPVALLDGSNNMMIVAKTPGGQPFYRRLPNLTTTFGSWTPLDGIINSRLELVQQANGRLFLLGLDAFGSLFAKEWNDLAQTWDSWIQLGGVLAGTPSAATVSGGTFVFGLTPGGSLFYIEFISPAWGPWTQLGGVLAGSTDAAAAAGKLFVWGTNPPGGLWDQQTPNGVFSGYEFLGGVLATGPEGAPVGNHFYVFANDAAGGTWTRKYDFATGTWGVWTNLGGVLKIV